MSDAADKPARSKVLHTTAVIAVLVSATLFAGCAQQEPAPPPPQPSAYVAPPPPPAPPPPTRTVVGERG